MGFSLDGYIGEKKRKTGQAGVGLSPAPVAQKRSTGGSYTTGGFSLDEYMTGKGLVKAPMRQEGINKTRTAGKTAKAAVAARQSTPATAGFKNVQRPAKTVTAPRASKAPQQSATAAVQAAPYAMGRDTYTPSSPYAAGIQVRQATQTPKSVKTDVSQPSFTQRVADTVSGGLKSTAASMTNMVGTLRELGQAGRDKQNQALIDDYARQLDEAQRWLDAALEDVEKDPGAWPQSDLRSFYHVRDDAQQKYDAVAKVYGKENQKGTIRGVYEAADEIQQSSAQDIAQAKEGLGLAGQMAVDAGAVLAQTAGDAVGGAATGNGMIPFAMRAFGSGTQKARQDGADLGGQMAYGAASTAKEVITEKMFGIALPFSRIYGGGAMDDVVKQTIQKAVDKLASTELGKKTLGGVLGLVASGTTEGLEDLVGDWLEWQLPRIYGGDTDSAIETLKNSLYDFGVSFIAGLAGEALSAGRHMGVDEDTAAQLRQTAEEMSGVEARAQSTQIDTDPDIHTEEQQKIIEAYQVNTDSSLRKIFESYLENPKQEFSRYNISPVTQRQASDVKRLLGGEYSGYTNAINSNGVIHILKEHGPEGTVDQSLGDLNDISRLSYVLEQYDDVEIVTYQSGESDLSKEFRTKDNRPAPMLKFRKRVDGTYYVIEAIPESKHKKFWVVSAYMEKADGGTQAPDANGPRNTPDASLASSPSASDPIIPSPGDGVKTEYAPQSGEDILAQAAREVTGDSAFATEQLDQTPIARRIQEEIMLDAMHGIDDEAGAQLRQMAAEMFGVTSQDTEVAQVQKTASTEGAVKADTTLFEKGILENFNSARKKLVEFARAHFPAAVVNQETGKIIGISRKGIDKFLSGNIPYEKYASGFHIPELIEHAHRVGDAANYHVESAENIPTFEYFDSPIEIEGKTYIAHIRVRNTLVGDKYYGHTISVVENIEIEHPTRTSLSDEPMGQPEKTGYSTSDFIIPSPGDGVNPEYTPGGGEDTLARLALEMDEERTQGWRKRNEETIKNAAPTFGEQGGKMFQKFYQNGDLAADEYYAGFAVYYHAGLTGQDITQVKSEYAQNLNPAQAEAAYLAGKLDAAAEQTETLPGEGGSGTIEEVNYIMKEGTPHGEERKESKVDFKRRCDAESYSIYEGSAVTCGYRLIQGESAQANARQVQEELRSLGIAADIIDGRVLWNFDGMSSTEDVPEAVTIGGKHIFINNAVALDPRNVAGHEAFHIWKGTVGRTAYIEMIENNLLYTSEAFQTYQATIAESYLGGEADLSDPEQVRQLLEELFAYISGDLYEGGHDAELAPMFRDFDAVKAAWETLVESQKSAALMETAGQGINAQADQWGEETGTSAENGKGSFASGPKRGIITSGAVSGAVNPLGARASKHAVLYYEEVRHMTSDVPKVAAITGYSEEQIQAVKNFIFIDKHDLGDKIAQFDPDFMMAESWQRLIAGKPEPHDLTLIHHEIMESDLIRQGYTQDEAHIMTSVVYNYQKEADEFYAKIKKFAKE